MTATATRPFGFWTATALVVGGMIGSGIFMMPAALAPFGWTGTIAWVVSIAGALSIAYALGCLTREMPNASGAIAITGAVLGEFPGVLIGWSYWVSTWSANAAIAIAAASYLSSIAPVLGATPLAGALTAVGLLWALTLLNLAGAHRAGQFQVVTTILKLVPLAAVLGIAAWLGARGDPTLPALPPAGTLLGGLATAVTLTLFPLVGFEAAGAAAERVRDPARNIMRATMIGTVVVGLIYILVCSTIVFLLPADAVAASPAPFALFFSRFVGAGTSTLIALFAAIAAIGALNCWVLLQGEVPLGMARAGLLPAWFGRVSRADVAVRVLLLSSGLASVLILTTSSPTLGGIFRFLALLTTCATLWFYFAICLAAVRRRRAVPAAIAGLVFVAFAMSGAGWQAVALSLVLMLSAVPLYLLRPRGSAQQPPYQGSIT
jgi:APA family basic amino acid/polyamine antiporter